MYLVAGVLFNKFHKGASGKEVIPNVNFWMDFPLLIKACKGLTWRNLKYLNNWFSMRECFAFRMS